MKAILLCAGKGTRLKPITNYMPKCLVPINGQPLLDIWLTKLENLKINKIYINTHHLNNQVEKFVKNHKLKSRITLVYEKRLLNTAGTLNKLLDDVIDQECLLIHADNYCQDDLSLLIKTHRNRPSYCFMTMMLFKTKEPSKCGIVKLNKDNVVTNYFEKKKKFNGNIANGAIYVLSKEFLLSYKQKYNNAKNFSEHVIPLCMNKIYTYLTKKLFIDIGTPKKYKQVLNLK